MTYGRKVGYAIEKESFENNIEDISDSNFRRKMGLLQ